MFSIFHIELYNITFILVRQFEQAYATALVTLLQHEQNALYYNSPIFGYANPFWSPGLKEESLIIL
jgi:hypothetical protein